MKKSLIGIISFALIIFFLLNINFPNKTSASDKNKTSELSQLDKVKVERVIDGDTFTFSQDGSEIKVRLIGVDTPESVASKDYLEKTNKENTQEGKDAGKYTKSLIEGKEVFLEFDVAKEDKYGRLLAYVYLENGKMVQDVLLENGYAELMTVPPNVKYAEHFHKIINKTR